MTRAGFDLLEAAERYGDARVAMERALVAWKPGDESIRFSASTLDDLKAAARAYATSTRRKRIKEAAK